MSDAQPILVSDEHRKRMTDLLRESAETIERDQWSRDASGRIATLESTVLVLIDMLGTILSTQRINQDTASPDC